MIKTILVYSQLLPAYTMAHIINETKDDFYFNAVDDFDKFSMELSRQNAYDLVIVDLLEGSNRHALVNKASKVNEHTAMLVLGKDVTPEDVAEVYAKNADDLVRVPFLLPELIYRIHAILRRTAIGKGMFDGLHRIGEHYTFTPKTRLITYVDPANGETDEIKVSPKESYVLQLLCAHNKEIVPRDKVLISVWGDSTFFIGRSLDVAMSNLRRFLSKDPAIQLLNVRGLGYRLIW